MSRERFQDALWYNKSVKIIVGGAGGIGSWVTFFATKTGFATEVIDFDIVEEHNLGGQLFLHQDIGITKVNSIANAIALFNDENYTLSTVNSKIDEFFYVNTSHKDLVIVVSAFDNMTARTNLFNCAVKRNNESSSNIWYVDGRLLMEQMRIYCVNLSDEKQVQNYAINHLFSDDEVEELPCTMKQVSHGAAMIASHMIGFITNIVSNYFVWKEDVFKVPFMWDYIISQNKITEEYGAS